MKDTPEPSKEEKVRYRVDEVATQTQPVIVDNETDETYDLYAALVKILNELEKLGGK